MKKFMVYSLWLMVFLLSTFYYLPSTTYAHAFGTLYTLPLPLWLYLWGAGAALIISFLVIGFFGKSPTQFSFPKFHLKINPLVILFLKSISFFLFWLTILTGFFGDPSAVDNFAVNFFWIIFLLGFTYLSAVFGNIWETINPLKIIVDWFGQLKPILNYPKSLGYIPALIFYVLLIWLELLSGGLGVKPLSLSRILLIYSSLTFLGILIFGRVWFQYGEFFSVFFGLIGKLSPFARPGSLLEEKPTHFSLLLFIIFMLSSTAFDGFRATSTWIRFYYNNLAPLENFLGNSGSQIIQTILLLLSPLFFLNFYLIAIWLMKLFSRSALSVRNLTLHFAFSLIPIALAYNVAHYYTLLLIQGQSIIPSLSDPLNLGWNLFGTADYQTNVGLLGASFVWHSQVFIIIIGHVLAVFLTHMMALKIFNRKQAFISQIPMLFLMVLYTVTGLWILSQPLTIGG